MNTAILALADGTVYQGQSIGVAGHVTGEVVFNTAITGYQEILTDPSYAKQIVTLTYPHIGNVGTNADDAESNAVWAAGMVVRDASIVTSNWRSEQSLADYLHANKVVAIAGVDTRQLTRQLRQQGALSGCILAGENPDPELAIQYAREFPGLSGADLAIEVATQQPYQWTQPTWQKTAPKSSHHVVVYDYGVKHNILRLLVDYGCQVTVVPPKTPAAQVLEMNPDGILLANGPGDPAACDYAIATIKELLPSNIPIFGICLGHQLLALACGAKTEKMKFGHHGANHPVIDLVTDEVFITSQNHGFTVTESSLPDDVVVTHRSLFDNTIQGIRHKKYAAMSFQGHPEASPGPHDLHPLFEHFTNMIKQVKTRGANAETS